MIDFEKIKSGLKTEVLGKNIVYEEITTSTNDMAKKGYNNSSGTVFLADTQTAGRGRNGKKWNSENPDGLWISILLKPQISLEKFSVFTLLAGLSIAKALTKLTGEKIFIKWPNDIVLDNKKLCGILCETVIKDDRPAIVCGIGINLNTSEFDDEIKDIACSLYTKTNKKFLREEVLSCVLNELEPLYYSFIKNGIFDVLDEYKKYCITIGKEVVIEKNTQKENAKAVDINENGELVIIKDNKKINIKSGEVSVHGLFGYAQ